MNFNSAETPVYILDEKKLVANLIKLKKVREEARVSIILALKGFAMWSCFDIIRNYLDGATASSLSEARLCYEEMNRKAHTYAVGYLPREFDAIMDYSSHITFNSLSQFSLYKQQIESSKDKISIGLRVNPQYSEIDTALYNPCSVGSRLGIHHNELKNLPPEVEGLHFHSLCENDSYTLEKAILSFEKHFGPYLRSEQIKWVNMGGGHLITGQDYNISHLIDMLKRFKAKYNVDVILEPGSAVAWQTGYLVSSVIDIVQSDGINTAILDISFTCHQPDTLEMPYFPKIYNATNSKKGAHVYRLGGVSCLAGDYLDSYSFEKELSVGDQIIFDDMMHYTMVKTTMFNGVTHPNIAVLKEDNSLELIRQFTYDDYKNRLG